MNMTPVAPETMKQPLHDSQPHPSLEAQPQRRKMRREHNPIIARYHGPDAPLGVRCANRITGFMGSWPFLWLQSVAVIVWIALNVFAWVKHFDPYPFILLNLAFSTQAAYAAPLILMAGNVAAAKDRELWEHDYQTNQQAYHKIESLEEQVRVIAEQNAIMLRQTQELLALLVAQQDAAS